MTRKMFRAHVRAQSLATVMASVPLERARLLRAVASTRPQAQSTKASATSTASSAVKEATLAEVARLAASLVT